MRQKTAAWILLFVFYSDFIGTLYARPAYWNNHYTGSDNRISVKSFNNYQYQVMAPPFGRYNSFRSKMTDIEVGNTREKNTTTTSKLHLLNSSLSGGPSQPEMASFKPAGADNMVNLFTGDMSYNIPLLDVGGYPINLFYSGGVTMDQEASWVGLGWNINPGSITRNMRGIPDDFDGSDVITKMQSIKEDKTVGVSFSGTAEVFGFGDLGAGGGVFWNNNRGVGLEATTSAGITLGLSDKAKDEKTSFSPSIGLGVSANLNSQEGLTLSPRLSINLFQGDKTIFNGLGVSTSYNSRSGIAGLQIYAEMQKYNKANDKTYANYLASYPMETSISFAKPSYTPSIRMPLTRSNVSVEFKAGGEFYGLHANASLKGYVTKARIRESDKEQKKPAVGYLYFDKANSNRAALLDFNRINDNVYTKNTPVISIPYYSYDVFSINGEGTGGSFRAYRGNIGYVRDPYIKSKSENDAFGFEFGAGSIVHTGIEFNYVSSPTTVYKWSSNNLAESALQFQGSEGLKEGVYFKNPGEKAIISSEYYNSIGADKLTRIKLFNPGNNQPIATPALEIFNSQKKPEGTLSLNQTPFRVNRDKRTQVISYLTAREAERVGLDKIIKSYPVNDFRVVSCEYYRVIRRVNEDAQAPYENYRRANHISEIDVLEPDGKRYVYGIPVYNTNQQEVSFSLAADQIPDQSGLISYNSGQNSINNTYGKDQLFQSEKIPAYPHSFLLTALLSPDYVDVKNDGITDDDLGDAVKFNYSRMGFTPINTPNSGIWQNYKWRTPFSSEKTKSAIFNRGIKTDINDNKASYTYGEREQWYLHSIESKNMIAVFTLEDRDDNKQPGDEDGTAVSNNNLKRLKKIDLFARAELITKGVNAKPIKTVYFEYEGERLNQLCKNNPNSSSSSGKLTLKSVWFSYNGNERQIKNKYVFQYGPNVDYSRINFDRWGNYKPEAINPASLKNEDYPYTPYAGTNEERARLDEYATSWNLTKILLPSGAQINIQYEADDYAYVQNRRACNMFKIAGFGDAPDMGYNPSNRLNKPGGQTQINDYDYVFIDVPEKINSDNPLTAKAEILQKYLETLKQLILKIWVKLPSDVNNPSDYEPLTVYAEIFDYGILPQSPNFDQNKNRIWIRVKRMKDNSSPMMANTIQFLKDNQPAKAFTGYNVDPDGDVFDQLVRALAGMAQGIKGAFKGVEKRLRAENACNIVDLDRAFIRLTNPIYKKVGGGYRVKRVIIKDNWNKMTGGYESTYGQEYDYSTTTSVNGEKVKISSGVATYEPSIGSEENPFKEVLTYDSKLPMGPTQYGFIDLPLGETFFPSPMVGYSKVRVRSIHNALNKNIKSGIGIQETTYYTSKDFPFISDYTDFSPLSNVTYKPDPILNFLKIDTKQMLTMSQGFRVVINDMNGKIRSQASYPENDELNPINYTEYFYKIKKMGENSYSLDNVLKVADKTGSVKDMEVGKDIEVCVDFREHKSETMSNGVQFNIDGFSIGPFFIPVPIMFKPPMKETNTFRSVSVLKIVNQYGIVDSVLQIDKGSMVSTKNLVYDAETGDVLVSRTNNEFNHPLFNLNYPAHWVYSGMEPAYKNIGAVYKSVVFKQGMIENMTDAEQMAIFESGDEIYVFNNKSTGPSNSYACIKLGETPTLPISSEYKIWALDIAKDDANQSHKFIFIDKDGNPYNSSNADIKIIRSGKRNLINSSVGSLSSLNNPITLDANGQTMSINVSDATNVINAGAVEFKEKWSSEEAFYVRNSFTDIVRKAPVRYSTVYPTNSSAYELFRFANTHHEVITYDYNSPYFWARNCDWGSHHSDWNAKSWLLFGLPSDINASTVIMDAKLSLYSHTGIGCAQTKISAYFPAPCTNNSFKHSSYNPRSGPHFFNNPHLGTENLFIVKRLRSSWPGDNQGAFRNIFLNSPTEEATKVIAGPTNYTGVAPNFTSYQLGATDTRLDVTRLLRNMIADKFNSSLQYATAIQIERPAPIIGWDERRVCFASGITNSQHLYLEGVGKPSILIKYYNCSESYGLPGNPATPPSWQETADCITRQWSSECLSVYSKKQMNPYVQGNLGNWRNYRSYVFYGERREQDPQAGTDISKNGVIQDFVSYWTFSGNQIARTDHPNWVWNSEISQVNRKGLEIENHDPLDRYNAGLYGYNSNLPVAVINNARYKESGFDGFEDYNYKDRLCAGLCKTERENASRHWKLGITNSMLSYSESHTGITSLKIEASSTFSISNPVSLGTTDNNPLVRIKINNDPYREDYVNPNGTGLTGYYFNNTTFSGNAILRDPDYPSIGNGPLPPGVRNYDMSVRWLGKLQPVVTGEYNFKFQGVDDFGYVYITGDDGTERLVAYGDYRGTGSYQVYPINLIAGHLYRVRIEYQQMPRMMQMKLLWKVPGPANFVEIPRVNLYPATYPNAGDGTILTQTFYCVRPDTIQVIKNPIIDDFTLSPGKKMVISAWVKEGIGICQVLNYSSNLIKVGFNGSTSSQLEFHPTGNIIEGWQRYECVFDIPQNAVSMQVNIANLGSVPLFVDDIRIHPFNSNMKSFVYNPVTLRLMAELDENNYATFYEYDNDGTLIRVKKETKEGVKTIKETRSGIQKQITTID
jgi:hypothetical protein